MCHSAFNHSPLAGHVCVWSCFSHVWLFVTPRAIACQAPLSMGFSRQEYWSGLPCPPSGDLPNPRIKPASLISPALIGRLFTTHASWEVLHWNHFKALKLFDYPRVPLLTPWRPCREGPWLPGPRAQQDTSNLQAMGTISFCSPRLLPNTNLRLSFLWSILTWSLSHIGAALFSLTVGPQWKEF